MTDGTAGGATVRVATAAEIEWLLGLAAAEGWNPGLDDAAAFRAADPEGFLVALDGGGEPLAGISVVRHDARFGFLGLYICHPRARGRGHGWRVWQAGIAHLGERAVGLDGVVAQQANYRRSGFEPAWRNVRFAGPAPRDADGARALPEARPADGAAREALHAYDRAVGGVGRARFLDAWLDDTPTRRSLCCTEAGRIVVLGTVRRCREHVKVGPLLAETPELARHLLAALAQTIGAERIVLDVPETNAAAKAMAEALGLKPVFETARMYRGDAPDVDLSRLYGVATLELG